MNRWLELLWALVAKEFKVRYKSTTLGFVWSVANPVFFALIFYVVFERLFGTSIPNYLVFLLTGLFPWQWFASTVAASPGVFLANGGLIKKVRFPHILLPLSAVTSTLLHFLLALLVALPLLAARGTYPSPLWLVGLPLLLLIQGALTLGTSLLVSSVNVIFRDLEYLTLIVLQMVFFMTPIFYDSTHLTESTRALLRVNPMYHLIPAWRELLLYGRLPWSTLGWSAALAAGALTLGYAVYHRMEGRLAESL